MDDRLTVHGFVFTAEEDRSLMMSNHWRVEHRNGLFFYITSASCSSKMNVDECFFDNRSIRIKVFKKL
jgi:hypothetical protein